MTVKSDSRSRVKDAEKIIRRIGFCFYDKNSLSWRPLSDGDHELLKLWLVLQLHLLDDLIPSHPYALRRFSQFLSQGWIDVVELGESIKTASKLLRLYPKLYEYGQKWTKASFKQMLGCQPATWCFFTPVLETLVNYFDLPDPSNLRTLLQWVDFGLKIKVESLDLTVTEETEYLVFNDEQRSWTYAEDVTSALADVIGRWVDEDSVYRELIPEHGNGATAELPKGSGAGSKYWALWSDPMLRWWLTQEGFHESDFYPVQPFWYNGPLARRSVLHAVPKTMTGNRLISMEPATLVYFQGALARQIDREVFRTLRNHIDLHDADKSATLARLGSASGQYDTIDLSSASDSVTKELVWRAFAKCPRLRRGLFATRSRWVKTSFGTVTSQFFAPMGSKLCFPVETLIFAAIVQVACARVGRGRARYRWRVYGDDIVVDRRVTSEVLQLLDKLHFTVNEKKSHFNTRSFNFREACGGEYFNDEDVRPVRLSRTLKFSGDLVSPEVVDSFVGLANNLFEASLLSTRRALMSIANAVRGSSVWKQIVFTTDGSVGIQTYDWSCTNYRLRMRRFRPRRIGNSGVVDFQFTEVYYYAASVKTQPFEDDEVRLFEWFRRSAVSSRPEDPNIYQRVDGAYIRRFEYAYEPIALGPAVATISCKWRPLLPCMGFERKG